MTDNTIGSALSRNLQYLALLVAALLVGCAAPVAKITSTSSGKPEVVIHTTDVGAIKSLILADLINYGYQIEKDTPYLLELTRPANSTENFGASLSIGNAYSTNYRVASYTFVQTNDGIRVIASAALRAQLPGGQVNSSPLNDNGNVYNTFQKQLLDIKKKLESTS